MDDEGDMFEQLPQPNVQHLFNKQFKHIPSFVLICLDDRTLMTSANQPNIVKFGQRSSLDYRSLTCEIKLLGGLPRCQPENDFRNNIPIAYFTNDLNYNKQAVKIWKEEERKEERFRDIFHENFIHDIINSGRVPDLTKYRLGDSYFAKYDGNNLLSGKSNWTKIPYSKPSDHDDNMVTIKEQKKDSPKSSSKKRLGSSCLPNDDRNHLASEKTNLTKVPESKPSDYDDKIFTIKEENEDLPIDTSEEILVSISPKNVRLRNREVSPISSDDEPSNLEERALGHNGNPRRARPNVGGTHPGSTKGLITFQEQMSMIKFVIDHNHYSKLKGLWLYKKMAEAEITSGRTHNTLETHMKRIILRRRNFSKFAMSDEARQKFLPYLRD